MRKFFGILSALLVVGIIGLYLLLFPPLPLPPEIGRDLPSNFAEADAEFAIRIMTEFPLPQTEQQLVDRLKQKGFSVSDGKNYAFFEKQSFPCILFWRVFWKSQSGTVTEINPNYGGSCL